MRIKGEFEGIMKDETNKIVMAYYKLKALFKLSDFGPEINGSTQKKRYYLKKGVQKRIDELTKKQRIAERERDYYKNLVESSSEPKESG